MRITTILAAAAMLGAGTAAASAASVVKTVDVKGTPDAIWAAIGPFCSIKDWHPAIGQCTTDGKTPVTRTLTTKDGKGKFVEQEVSREDSDHTYTYAIKSSPLPVTGYKSIIKVAAKGPDTSVITWSSTYTPDNGKDAAAAEAIGGIYQSGLDAVQAKMAK